MKGGVFPSTYNFSQGGGVQIPLVLLHEIEAAPGIRADAEPWLNGSPSLTDKWHIKLSVRWGGGSEQARQLPAPAETPLVNLPLAGLNMIWNVKSFLRQGFFHFPKKRRHMSHDASVMRLALVWWINVGRECQSITFISEIPFVGPVSMIPLLSWWISKEIKLIDKWLANLNAVKLTFRWKDMWRH